MDQQAPQRRSGTIVCMDMVGYSSHMASDEGRTVAALHKFHRDVIERGLAHRNGRLSGRAGDSWLIEFSLPEPALHFSLETLRDLRSLQSLDPVLSDMQVRIGINCGEYVEDDGILHGNSVNVAARLQAIARPGGISISAQLRDLIGDDVPCRFLEIGPRAVKNIPNPVFVYRVLANDGTSEPEERERLIDVARQVPGLANRPAIAVLPFRNIGSDPEQEYFSDGLTEDIINGLARFRWFPVIARSSTFQFKDSPLDVREIGRQLGARYVVEGSVRRVGNRLRATAHLSIAEQGVAIWHERYDREMTDLFLVQDEISQSLIATLEPELSRAEDQRSRGHNFEQLGDWELVRRGMWHQNRLTREDAAIARSLFDQALARNPDSVEAMVQLSWWHFWDVWANRGPMEGWVEMERLARRAMVQDPMDARGHCLAGIAEVMQGGTESGRDLLNQAITLNPSLGRAYAHIGTSYILTGEPEMALEPIDTSLRLSPNDEHIFHALGEKAVSLYMTGDFQHAIAAADASLQHRPGYSYAHIIRIGSLARLGRDKDAAEALQTFVTRRPQFQVNEIEWLPFTDRHWVKYLIEGLRLAGLH